MFDRTLIIVLVLLLVAGGFCYERYAAERGEIGPVGHLIDFTKFGKTADLFTSSSKRKLSQYNSSASLSLLREKHVRLEKQRAKLVENRRDILKQLIDINDDIVNEALGYAHLIDEDRDRFLDRFPEIQEMGGTIVQTSGIADPAVREEHYQVIRQHLEDVLHEITEGQPDDMMRLTKILDEMDRIVNKEEEVLASCPDWDVCINRRLDDLKGEAKDISDRILGSAKEDIASILKMTNELKLQYEGLGENLEVSNKQIEASNEVMAGKLKLLAESLSSITESDLKNVVDAYDDVQAQQELLLENLALHQDRVRQIQEDNNRRTQQMMENIKRVPRSDSQKLVATESSVRLRRGELFGNFENNELRLRKVIREQWTEDNNLLVELVQHVPIDANKLIEDRKYAQRRTDDSRPQISSTGSNDLSGFERNNDLKVGRSQSYRKQDTYIRQSDSLRLRGSDLNNRKKEEATEQFKRLKNKARDQGF